jgi:uracil-DNA glycosylase family 4
MNEFERLSKEVSECRRCERLVEYRERIGREKKKAFQNEEYWARGVPGFGDPNARMLILGLAPAAHGSNRTGRMFTGDGERGAGDFMARALHKAGLASVPFARDKQDGMILNDLFMTARARCAPPQNKPTTEEFANCAEFLRREFELLANIQVVIAMGKMAFDGYLKWLVNEGVVIPKPKPNFSHGAIQEFDGRPTLLASYHPSRQNTQTGKLTIEMFDEIFVKAQGLLK